MLYCTYDQYAAAGGTVPETAFGVLCSRASRMIDAATFGRAETPRRRVRGLPGSAGGRLRPDRRPAGRCICGGCCAGCCQRLQRRLQRHLWQQCQCDRRRPAGSL